MTDCHDHVDFKANPSLSKWEENILRLSLIRKFVLNISEKFPKSEVYEKLSISKNSSILKIKTNGDELIARDIYSIEDDEFNIRGTFEDESRLQNGETNGKTFIYKFNLKLNFLRANSNSDSGSTIKLYD